jgi:hypothetical protein
MPSTQMPLLTLSGFTEFCKIEALSDPDAARNHFNIVIRHYDLAIWRERGEIPRWVLPPNPVPQMLERIAQVQARALGQAAARNQNSAARMRLHDAQIYKELRRASRGWAKSGKAITLSIITGRTRSSWRISRPR